MATRERRREVRLALEGGRLDDLAGRVATGEVSVTELLHFLYDSGILIRHRAATAIGLVAARAPERVRQLPERLLWAMNDESGNACRGAAAAMAEIALARPALAAGFVAPMAHKLDDDEHLVEVLWYIAQVAPRFPDCVKDLAGEILARLHHAAPEVRGMAALALGHMGLWGDHDEYYDLVTDLSEIEYYRGGILVRETIRDIAIRDLLSGG